MSESAAPGTPEASPLSRPTPPAPGPRGRAPVDTTPPFFQEGEVSVSTTRIVAYGTPASLVGVKSVRLFVDKPHLRFAIIILLAGIGVGAYGAVIRNSPACALGVMLAVVSYLTYRFQNMRHKLFVTRETGPEAEIFVAGNLDFTHRVLAAVEQALAQQAQTATAASAPTATSQDASVR